MRFLTVFALFALLGTLACRHRKTSSGTSVKEIPACIREKIDAFTKLNKKYQPAYVTSYTYKGKRVFYFPDRCCDQQAEVWDEQCNLVCAPQGGFTGTGDGKCKDFFSEARDSTEVWAPPPN